MSALSRDFASPFRRKTRNDSSAHTPHSVYGGPVGIRTPYDRCPPDVVYCKSMPLVQKDAVRVSSYELIYVQIRWKTSRIDGAPHVLS